MTRGSYMPRDTGIEVTQVYVNPATSGAVDRTDFPLLDPLLLDGLEVEIHLRGRIIDRGRVDGVTTDRTMLWLKQDGITPRRLVHQVPAMCVVVCNHPADQDQDPHATA